MSFSESRNLTKLVGVRLTPEDLDLLRGEAERQNMTVAEFLRENTLRSVRTAS